jgi:hypothetical protein
MLFTEHGQDPFDQLDDKFKQNIEKSLITDNPDQNESDEEQDNALIDSKLLDYICNGKKFIKLNNLYNILDVIYKFITYRLIPMTIQVSDKNMSDENEVYDAEFSIEDLLMNDEFIDHMISISSSKTNIDDRIDLNLFNFRMIKLKHIYHLWKLFVQLYIHNKSNLTV